MQNPFELVFQDVSTFDAQNPVACSMVEELDIGKKDIESNLVKKAPKTGLTNDIQKRLDALRGDNFFNNNNNNFSPPTFNNFVPPPQAPPPPFNSFNYCLPHRYQHLTYHHHHHPQHVFSQLPKKVQQFNNNIHWRQY